MSPISLSLSVFLCFCQFSLFSLTHVIGYMFTYKSYILEIHVWLKMRKHLKMGRTSQSIPSLLDHVKQIPWLLPSFPQKFLFPSSLLCDCFPFGITLPMTFYLLWVQMWIQLIPLLLFLFHLPLCGKLFHISTACM